jgi:WD40 repeat protein
MRSLFTFVFLIGFARAQSYVRDVFPIWEKHCLGCHASGTKMGSLDIETWEGLQRGGNHGTILVPGDAKASRLYTMLIGEGKPAMPMDGQVLSQGEMEVVRKWIAAGATPPTAAEIEMLQRKAAGEEAVPIAAPAKVQASIYSLAIRPGRREIAIGRSGIVDLLDPSTGRVQATLEGPAGAVRALAYSQDYLAAAGGTPGQTGEVLFWDLQSRSILTRIHGHRVPIEAIALSPDGKLLATGSADGVIKLWDAQTGRAIRTLKGHAGAIVGLAFTPDGKQLLSCSAEGAIKTWEPRIGKQLYTFAGPFIGLTAVALSPDGRRVAAAGIDKIVRIWELGGTLTQTSTTQAASVIALAWSPNGAHLASSGADQSVKIFNATDLSELKAFSQSSPISVLAFSAESQIDIGGRDGSFAVLKW